MDFAKDFGKPPEKLGADELRTCQTYLLREAKLAVGAMVAYVAALRFLSNRPPRAPTSAGPRG